MADIIKLLPDTVANQIAAGEVIQRPSSVIKELVENSADAGATEINIEVRDAGRTLIQVTDNGKGMSPTDARMAFERHATSKIRQASDLFALHTMGFRGEALPSISAISQVEVLTAVAGVPMGTRLTFDNLDDIPSQEPCYCAPGTTIKVKNIFYNVPARRRFLKSDTVELTHIVHEFERLALVNPNIRFTFDTGSRKRDLRAGSFKQRITDLWKGSLNPELLPVEVETDIVKISGFITRPEHARRRNALQYLIANGRCMRHPYFMRAVASCYEKLIAPDTKPCYFLRFEVDPAKIDVNIHPTKNEIKFEDEQEIYRLLTSAVHAALGKHGSVPSIDFESDAIEVKPLMRGEQPMAPASAGDPGYNPFKQQMRSAERWRTQSLNNDWQALFQSFTHDTPVSDRQTSLPFDYSAPKGTALPEEKATETPAAEPRSLEVPPSCVQLDNSFIITPGSEGLMVIDQHRAHVAVLYNQFMRRSDNDSETTLQGVLFGEELKLDTRQTTMLEEALPHLKTMGITLRRQGEAWVIASLPAGITGAEGRDIIFQVLDALQTDSDQYGKPTTDKEALRRRLALSLARSAAICKGKRLSQQEMDRLTADLFKLPNPVTGPDGKKIIFVLELNKINSIFS